MRSARTILTALAVAGVSSACQREQDSLRSVVISVPQQSVANVAKATIVVDYSRTGARIASEAGSPACAFILPGVDGDFSDDRQGTLTIHTHGPRALRSSADVAACRMEGAEDATTASLQEKLTVKVTGAEDATGKTVDVSPKAGHGAATTPARSEAEIERAQAEAAKAAAAIASAPIAPAGAPGATGVIVPGVPGAAGNAGMPATGAPPRAWPGAPGSPSAMPGLPGTRPPGANPAGSAGSNLFAGGNASAGNASTGEASNSQPTSPRDNQGRLDNDGTGLNTDPDPTYDDSCDGSPPQYTLEVHVNSGTRLGALQLQVTHLGRAGCFVGRGEELECSPLVDALIAQNYPGERTAKIGLISLAGMQPGKVVSCQFRTREPLSPASFAIAVDDASQPSGEPIEPPPVVTIGNITRR